MSTCQYCNKELNTNKEEVCVNCENELEGGCEPLPASMEIAFLTLFIGMLIVIGFVL